MCALSIVVYHTAGQFVLLTFRYCRQKSPRLHLPLLQWPAVDPVLFTNATNLTEQPLVATYQPPHNLLDTVTTHYDCCCQSTHEAPYTWEAITTAAVLAALVAWLRKSRILISKLVRITYVDMISFLDFKLSPCFESNCMYSFGYFPGVWLKLQYADVSEHSISSIFKGWMWGMKCGCWGADVVYIQGTRFTRGSGTNRKGAAALWPAHYLLPPSY